MNLWEMLENINKSFLLISLVFIGACKSVSSDYIESEIKGTNQAHAKLRPLSRGISTQHQAESLGLTHCALSKAQVKSLAQSGYYYVAVNDKFFGEFQGKACGQIFEVEVGGACYRAPSQAKNMDCLKDEWHASLDSELKSSVPRKLVVIVADRCFECLSEGIDHHLDILDLAYKDQGKLSPLRSFLEKNTQQAKRVDGTTLQPSNLYLKSIKHAGCLGRQKVQLITGASIPEWGDQTRQRWCG